MKRIEQLTFRQEVWTRFSSLYSAIFKLSWLTIYEGNQNKKSKVRPRF